MKRLSWQLTLAIAVYFSGLTALYAQHSGAPGSEGRTVATGMVMTVSGPIDPATLGQTLIHEHIFIDSKLPDDFDQTWAMAERPKPRTATAVAAFNAPMALDNLFDVSMGVPNRDNYVIDDEKVQTNEIEAYRNAAGSGATIVDLTNIGLKRNPDALLRVSKATGVHVVMGSSWAREPWSTLLVKDRSVESLTAEIVRDVTVGVGESGIRSGIIGEVSFGGHALSEGEIRVLRASGRASRLTGAPIVLATSELRHEQSRILDLLKAEGVDPGRIVVGHSNPIANDLPFMTRILDRGVYIAFDTLGRQPTVNTVVSDYAVALAIVQLVKAGHTDRILLSQDVSTKLQLHAYGGAGYSYLPEFFLQHLKQLGVTDAQVKTIMVENPRRVLTLAAPRK